MVSKKDTKDLIKMFKALSSDVRFNIVQLLNNQNLCVGALSRKLNISQASVSQHLRILKDAELMDAKRIGNFTHYKVNNDTLAKCETFFHTMIHIKRKQCIKAECKGNANEKK